MGTTHRRSSGTRCAIRNRCAFSGRSSRSADPGLQKMMEKEPERRFSDAGGSSGSSAPILAGSLDYATCGGGDACIDAECGPRPLSQSMQPTAPATPGTEREPDPGPLPGGTPQPRPMIPRRQSNGIHPQKLDPWSRSQNHQAPRSAQRFLGVSGRTLGQEARRNSLL